MTPAPFWSFATLAVNSWVMGVAGAGLLMASETVAGVTVTAFADAPAALF